MTKKFKNLQVTLSLIMAVVMCCLSVAPVAHAQKAEILPNSEITVNEIDSEVDVEQVSPRAHASIIYPVQTTFYLSGGTTTIKYQGIYGMNGAAGVLVLRFTNTDTNEGYYTCTFNVDGVSYTKNYSLPAGNYQVSTVVNTVTNFRQINLNFS